MERQGLTAEMYRAVVEIIDDRLREIKVTREEFDRLTKAVEGLAQAQAQAEERLSRLEAAVERLAEAQRRTEERLNRLEAAVERLAEAQRRTEERLNRLEAAVERLAEAQRRTEERVEQLAEAQRRTEKRLQELIRVVADIQDKLAAVRGRQLELTYKERAAAYFGPLLRHLRVRSLLDIEETLESSLSPEEFYDLLNLDLLVSGRPRHLEEAPEVLLAVEISTVVDRKDVTRARQRADFLRRAGYKAIPTVAGEEATMGAEQEARKHKVLMLQDGRAYFWEEALQEILT